MKMLCVNPVPWIFRFLLTDYGSAMTVVLFLLSCYISLFSNIGASANKLKRLLAVHEVWKAGVVLTGCRTEQSAALISGGKWRPKLGAAA